MRPVGADAGHGATNSGARWGFDLVVLACIAVACTLLSVLIPPLQSPDEADHVRRAYGLTQGVLLLEAPPEQMSGLRIDTGLQAYLDAYHWKYMADRAGKLALEEMRQLDAIGWSGQHRFATAPGTGYYLPLIYAPQAAGLALGKALGASVDTSYRLARSSALVASVLLLALAFRWVAPPAGVLALLLLPMTLFQWSSASLDGISTAWAVVALAAFVRMVRDGPRASPVLLVWLCASLVLVVTTRVHLLPLLALPVLAGWHTRQRRCLWAAAGTVLLVLAWLVLAVKTTVDTRVVREAGLGTVAAFYLSQPGRFFGLLWQTLVHERGGEFYADSFIGLLGWLDVPLPEDAIALLAWWLGITVVLGCAVRGLWRQRQGRVVLGVAALASSVLVFAALLLTWNPHPATFIEGVQGRYFIVPALALAYALAPADEAALPPWRWVARASALGLGVYAALLCANTLLRTYFAAESRDAAVPPAVAAPAPEPAPVPAPRSAMLQPGSSLTLVLPAPQLENPQPVAQLGVLMRTAGRTPTGHAELLLTSADGQVWRERFALAEVKDGAYRHFAVPLRRYVKGEIVSLEGAGIQLQQSNAGAPLQGLTCLVWADQARRLSKIPGCPDL